MMSARPLTAMCVLAVLIAPGAGRAAGFVLVGRTPGQAAQIGAVRGTTLYGTSADGGAGAGTLFSMSITGSYTLLHNFVARAEGKAPNARLALDAAGDLFGTAFAGGAHGGGTLWEYAAAGMTVLHAFGAPTDGTGPLQGPTLSRDGLLFGTTYMGAANQNGGVFGMPAAPAGGYSVMYSFRSGSDGHCPFSGVASRGSDLLYGTTVGYGYGGDPHGSVWRYSAAYGLHTIHAFTDGADGGWPDQAPVVGTGGTVYGTTHMRNGADAPGVVWAITAAGQFAVLHAMNADTEGDGPNSPLLIGADGNLYGTTGAGGPGGHGTLFQVTPAGTLAVLHAFDAGVAGSTPTGNLVRDAHGTIYGGTEDGVVFAYMP